MWAAMRAPDDFYARDDGGELAPRLATVMLSLGAFVSFTTAGRLVPAHLVGTALAYSFLPVLQGVSLAVAMRAGGGRRSLAQVFSGHLAGYGPWALLLAVFDALCAFAPDVLAALGALFRTGVLPVLALTTIAWSVRMQHALLRASGARGFATAVYYGTFVALVVGWYVLNGDMLPLLGVLP